MLSIINLISPVINVCGYALGINEPVNLGIKGFIHLIDYETDKNEIDKLANEIKHPNFKIIGTDHYNDYIKYIKENSGRHMYYTMEWYESDHVLQFIASITTQWLIMCLYSKYVNRIFRISYLSFFAIFKLTNLLYNKLTDYAVDITELKNDLMEKIKVNKCYTYSNNILNNTLYQ